MPPMSQRMDSDRLFGRAWPLAFGVIAFAILPLHAAERTLLHRSFPTDVSWGEISIAQGPQVVLPKGDERVTYPFSLAIVCNQRERREDVREATGQAVATPLRRRGTLYLAAELPGGRKAWNQIVETVQSKLGGLTPETFGTFAEHFPNSLTGADAVYKGPFEAAVCAAVDGRSDQAWTVKRTIDPKTNAVFSGLTGYSGSHPICRKLAGALDGEPASDVMASRFEVRAQREETLAYDDVASPGTGPAPWPEGSGIAYGPPPEVTGSYSHSDGDADGEITYEELRQPRTGGARDAAERRVLKAKAKAGPIPVGDLDADVLLSRWTWRVRDLQLGTDPTANDAESATFDVAFLFTAAHGAVDGEGVARTVAGEFAGSDEKPGIALLRRLVQGHLRDLGADAMVAVLCDPATPREATFCVAGACPNVTNAEEFCRALAARLDRP
jgi:hypothetical protein